MHVGGPLIAVALYAVLAAHVRSAYAEWSVIAENRTSYTTDAFQFSNARRLRFTEDPSQPTGVSLNKPQDVVWEPAAEIRDGLTSSLGHTFLSFKAQGVLYTNNPIFDHGNYRAQIEHAFTPDTSVLFRYRYTPDLFLGPNIEHRTGRQLIEGERVTSHIWRTEVMQRLADAWTLGLIGRYGLRLYNEAFAERNTHFWTGGPQVHYQLLSNVILNLGYLYERGLADGRGNPTFDDDVSYRSYSISFGTDVRLTPVLSVSLIYLYQRKDFTSDLIGDTHNGRRDQSHQGIAELKYSITSCSNLILAVQRTQRTSTNALRDFNDTITSLGGQITF
jgi:hypothetical protein